MSANAFNGGFDTAMGSGDPVALIEALLGVTPVLDESYDMLRPSPDDRLQVRIGANNAPKFMVERFAFQMAMAKFPPIIITEDDYLVDGNTRYHAARFREERWFPAYIIPISYAEADDDTQNKLVFLGKLLNNSNGLPLDKAERQDMIARGLSIGLSQTQMQSAIGFKASTVAAAKREIDGRAAIERVGLSEKLDMDTDKPKLKGAALAAVGQFANVNDEPLAEAVKLAAEAQLGAREIKGLMAEVREAKSDKGALRIVKNARKENAPRIADVRSGKVGKPPASRLLRQRLGFITGDRTAESMVENNPEDAQNHLDQIRAAIEVLEEVERLQVEQIGAAA